MMVKTELRNRSVAIALGLLVLGLGLVAVPRAQAVATSWTLSQQVPNPFGFSFLHTATAVRAVGADGTIYYMGGVAFARIVGKVSGGLDFNGDLTQPGGPATTLHLEDITARYALQIRNNSNPLGGVIDDNWDGDLEASGAFAGSNAIDYPWMIEFLDGLGNGLWDSSPNALQNAAGSIDYKITGPANATFTGTFFFRDDPVIPPPPNNVNSDDIRLWGQSFNTNVQGVINDLADSDRIGMDFGAKDGSTIIIPLPATAWSGMVLLAGVAVVRRIRRSRA